MLSNSPFKIEVMKISSNKQAGDVCHASFTSSLSLNIIYLIIDGLKVKHANYAVLLNLLIVMKISTYMDCKSTIYKHYFVISYGR